MRKNSLQALEEERYKLSKRESLIYEYLRANPSNSYTDRQIMRTLQLTEPNQVRPRITSLIEKKMIFESGNTKCQFTGKTVRLIKLNNDTNRGQMDLFGG
jgi:hypothetical protein